jgi:hypothetical protein
MNSLHLTIPTALALLTGCVSGPTPREGAAPEQSRQTRESERKQDAEAFRLAAVSRAALKQFIKLNPSSTYVPQAVAALDLRTTKLTVVDQKRDAATTSDGRLLLSSFTIHQLLTVGKSTRGHVERFLGAGTDAGPDSASGHKRYKWHFTCIRGEVDSDFIQGYPFAYNPAGDVILSFDANDILRDIQEVD